MPITVSGTQITFNDATVQTTAFTGGSGTVTSVATGNGLQGGTITTSGTLSVACPTFNTVGSYCTGGLQFTGPGTISASSGSNYSAGGSQTQIQSMASRRQLSCSGAEPFITNNLSGTWKWMGANTGAMQDIVWSVCCRVS